MLAVAGLSIELVLRREGVAAPLPEWLLPFERGGRGDLRLSLDVEDSRPAEITPLSVREGAVNGDGLVGQFDLRDGALTVRGGEGAMRQALRLACAIWGAPRGIVLFHGACAVLRNGAHLFLGASGAGKTTLSRLLAAEGAHVLSDEVSAASAGRARVHGHPFRSHLGDGLPYESPLTRIWVLEHGAEVSTQPLGAADAVRSMLPRVFQPLRDAATVGATLDAVHALAREVPVARFSFAPTAVAAQTLVAEAA
jgi:hypothetical protein